MTQPRRTSLRTLTNLAGLAALTLALGLTSCAKPKAEDSEAPVGRGGAEPGVLGTAGGGGLAVEGEAAAVFVDPARIETLGTWAADNVEGERYRVPVEADDMVFGSPTARVTIVVFNDYQCPYCSRFDQALRQLIATYPTDVRVVIKQFPLSMHQRAAAASRAVLAAHRQGVGQAMHQLVFDNQKMLDDEGLRQLAARAQVPDPRRFDADFEGFAFEGQLTRDKELAMQLGVSSTPSFFVNGVPERGAKTLEQLEELYAREVTAVAGLIDAGAARGEIYDALMANAAPTRTPPARKPSSNTKPAGKPDPDLRYAVPVDGRPSKGASDALVTIVQFADFECPFCRRVIPTLDEIERRYGKDVRFVYMQQPLPMHKQAENAAKAALAAHRQGKFWDMHDRLYALAETRSLADDVYERVAKELQLDVKRFRRDFADPKLLEGVRADQAVGTKFGARGTPSFFINGRPLSGAQPVEAFAALVDEELAAAKAYKKKHKVAGDKLYASMSTHWETEVAAPSIASSTRQQINLKGVPVRGKSKQAPIELVVCADFDCPYCKRGADMVDQAMADRRYRNKIGFYFLHFPLPMHVNAEAAHRAAIAADAQGKFWEMHDQLFANKSARSESDLVSLAKQLGLDTKRFRQDMNSQATTDKIAADKATCTQLGVSGTPNFFVNGRSMRGALPLDMAAQVFDEELGG